MIDTIWQDVRFGVRSLRRSRLFSITSILTLALGIAAATSIFSLVDGILIRPLPFADEGRLVVLALRNSAANATAVSYPDFIDLQAQSNSTTFDGLAFARGRGTTLTTPDGSRNLIVALTSPGFFRVLGQRPMLGRLFTADEERDGGHVVVLTYGAWQDEFDGDRQVIGRTMSLSDGLFTVIGVLPRGVNYPDWAGLYFPVSSVAGTEKALSARGLRADSRTFARLAPGATAARAEIELTAIAKRLAAAYPDVNGDWPAVRASPLRDEVLDRAPSQLTMLTVAVGLVLLIGWVNVANLAVVRATGRARELAIRVALGASRGRIVRQLLTEYLLLATIAGIIGGVTAVWAVAVVKQVASGILPRVDTVAVSGRVLAFTLAIVLLSAVAIGLLPALRSGAAELTDSLKQGGTGTGAGHHQQRVRATLVVGEIGLALTLVIAAGLLIKSFWRLSNVDPGFNTHQLVAIDFSPPGTRYWDTGQGGVLYSRVLDAVRAIPGVRQAALTNHLPLNGAALPTKVAIPGRTSDPKLDPTVLFRTISPEYLTTMGIPLRRGRGLTNADLTAGTAVLVNEVFAKAFWPGQDPVGRSVTLHKSAQGRPDFGEPFPGMVVGVIGDVHHFGVAAIPVAEIYIPYTRNPWLHMVVIARAAASPQALIPGMRRALLGVDPSITLTGGTLGGFKVVDDIRADGLSGQRLNMSLLGGFGLCALLLSAIGVYGLMAYVVAQRGREIGIRLALGAQARDVLRMMLGTGARLIVFGIVLGVGGAFALTRIISGALFGVAPTDPATFVAMTAVLATVALIACYLPARRAGRVDPAVALRNE